MSSKVRLSAEQKKALSVLEPQLRLCLKSGDLNKAKKVTGEIVKLLRPTGHDTRILQAKNWLFEVAMEAGSLTYAKLGFEGIIKKSAGQTRLHLEATALLAICYIREQNLDMARELIFKAVRKINNIKSVERRKQFHNRLLERLEEESILVGLVNQGGKPLDIDQVDSEAVKLVMSKTEDEILIEMGKAVPKQSIEMLNHVRETYQLRIAYTDKKLLPPPLTEDTKVELGKRANTALKRVAWRALCSPESEIFKAWSNGLSVVYDKKYIAGAIVASFNSFSISATMIAASAAALAIKFGAEVFCETFAPKSMMIERTDKS